MFIFVFIHVCILSLNIVKIFENWVASSAGVEFVRLPPVGVKR